MRYAVLFASRTGNTDQVAAAIRAALGAADCLAFGEPSPAAAGAELLFVGSWTDKGDCDPAIAAFLAGLTGGRVALFGTAGFGGDAAYFDRLAARFAAHLPPACALAGHYFCQGRMPAAVRARYEGQLAQHPDDPRLRQLLENFDAARPHPDQADLDAAAAFARRVAGR